MDHIYGYLNKTASSKIAIDEYFNDYRNSLRSSQCFQSVTNHRDVFQLMGAELNDDEKSMLEEYCSIDNLTVEGEVPRIKNHKLMRKRGLFESHKPADADLETLRHLKRRAEGGIIPYCKYKSELMIDYDKTDGQGDLLEPEKDILVYVRVYSPFINLKKHEQKVQMGSRLQLHAMFAIAGSQTLADLRDKINCRSEYTIPVECSNNLKKAIGPMAKDVYKSGFFFIEDTFYNDKRDPSNIEYSQVIIDWAKRKPIFGQFNVSSMETCRIDTLYARFGFPWVYKHVANCEHLICLSNARLVAVDDELRISEYPRIIRIKQKYCKLCLMCGVYSAQWFTLNHDRIPHNPCFFCEKCFKSYNYVNGKKVGNFSAYRYPQNTELFKDLIETND